MSIAIEDLQRIVTEVWRDVLSLEAVPASEPASGELTGCIQITGAFHGAVVLNAQGGVTRQAAMAMFAMEAADVGGPEERDALGELTNMVGGHVKAMLPGPSQLALPSVVPGCNHCLERCQLQPMASCAMMVPGGVVIVTVLEDVG